jgi:hypothetical protein
VNANEDDDAQQQGVPKQAREWRPAKKPAEEPRAAPPSRSSRRPCSRASLYTAHLRLRPARVRNRYSSGKGCRALSAARTLWCYRRSVNPWSMMAPESPSCSIKISAWRTVVVMVAFAPAFSRACTISIAMRNSFSTTRIERPRSAGCSMSNRCAAKRKCQRKGGLHVVGRSFPGRRSILNAQQA